MDLIELRRRILLSMASGSLMDDLFEVVATVHLDQTVNEIIIPFDAATFKTGCYIVVTYPLVSPQTAVDEGTYIFKAGEFVCYGTSKSFIAGQGYLFKSNRASDYWQSYALKQNNNTELAIYCGPQKQVSFPKDHDIYIIRVKGE